MGVNQKDNRIGEMSVHKSGLKMIILEYDTRKSILIKFLDSGELVTTNYSSFINGTVKIKKPYEKTVYGVGYFGEGIHRSSRNNRMNHKYKTWHEMIRRCYDKKKLKSNPSYFDCTVCDEWHNFQSFGDWYDNNFYQIEGEQMHLDKDILVKWNRVYSPESCIFVPARINCIFTKNGGKKKDDMPFGVIQNNHKTKIYTAKCADDKGKTMYINSFNTVEEAFNAYKKHKELSIRDIANKYKDKIPEKLYNAMINYRVEIND